MSQDNASRGHPQEDVRMTDAKETTSAGGLATGSKKPISMDAYHQLQQKRKLEQQQQQQQQQQQKQSQRSATEVHPHDAAKTTASQPSLDALEQIVSMVQSTVHVMPPVPPPQQEMQMPGPDLANIIFGNSSQTVPALSMESGTATVVNGHPVVHGNNNNHHSSNSNNTGAGQHRKSATGGSSSVITAGASNSQPRTTSPPTPVSGSSSGTQKVAPAKGPKPIHAIELIRIAGEILQFPPATVGTALIYYHKYRAYLYQSIKKGERDNEAFKADEYLFATACLHLASKCTEVSRKVRDLVNVTYRVMNPGQPVLSLSTKSGDTDESSMDPASLQQQEAPASGAAPPPTATTYWHIRDSLLTTELMLLRILQFDLDVSLPFNDVLRIYKGMGLVFNPTDEEAAQLYPSVSNFDVFLPADISNSGSRNQVGSSSSSPNKYGTPSSSSSTSSSAPGHSPVTPAAHVGIHPTLSALVQISITFCIDALCNSGIALQSSSRALAMGSIYLAVRSAQLELPMPFEDWCYAWGSPQIATSLGMAGAGVGGSGPFGGMGGSSVGGVGGPGSNTSSSLGGSGGAGVNGIMGLPSTNSLFVSTPRPVSSTSDSLGSQAGSFAMDGVEMTTPTLSGLNGSLGGVGGSSKDPAYSQTHSPLLSSSNSPALQSPIDPDFQQQLQPSPQTIVDEVRKVVQELAGFYTH